MSGQGAERRPVKSAPGSWGEKFSPPPPPALGAHDPAVANAARTGSPVVGDAHPEPALRVLPSSHPEPQGQDLALGEDQEADGPPQAYQPGADPSDGQADGQVVSTPPAAQGPAHAHAVWAPAHLRDAAGSARTATGESMTEYFLGAFNRTWSSLPSMFPRVRVPSGPMPMRATRRRRNVATAVQLWLYLDVEQAAVLAEAVVSLGAGSRSALVSAVLAAELNMPAH